MYSSKALGHEVEGQGVEGRSVGMATAWGQGLEPPNTFDSPHTWKKEKKRRRERKRKRRKERREKKERKRKTGR